MATAQHITMPDADISVWPGFFDREQSDAHMNQILEDTEWAQERITLYGKTHDVPRLTAWHGDRNKEYCYSGIKVISSPWTPALLDIKSCIEKLCPGVIFNSVLLNLYRSGNDSVAWHSDDEAELGQNPAIGSVTFGACRSFQLKHRSLPNEKLSLRLGHGDYLLMKGATQHNWVHRVPRTRKKVESRLNLTFRRIID